MKIQKTIKLTMSKLFYNLISLSMNKIYGHLQHNFSEYKYNLGAVQPGREDEIHVNMVINMCGDSRQKIICSGLYLHIEGKDISTLRTCCISELKCSNHKNIK